MTNQETLEKDFDKKLEKLMKKYLSKGFQPILITEILDMHSISLKNIIKNIIDKKTLNSPEKNNNKKGFGRSYGYPMPCSPEVKEL